SRYVFTSAEIRSLWLVAPTASVAIESGPFTDQRYQLDHTLARLVPQHIITSGRAWPQYVTDGTYGAIWKVLDGRLTAGEGVATAPHRPSLAMYIPADEPRHSPGTMKDVH